jgi:hypothetical protein
MKARYHFEAKNLAFRRLPGVCFPTMKRLLCAVLLFLPVIALGEKDYPLTLRVVYAHRMANRYGQTTEVRGYLSDEPQQQLHMSCDVGIFSIGPDGKLGNKYLARRNKAHEIKIGAREEGSDKIHEHTCKY